MTIRSLIAATLLLVSGTAGAGHLRHGGHPHGHPARHPRWHDHGHGRVTVVRVRTPARAPARAVADPAVARGLAFAQTHCTACHAVVPNGTSPNPESPPFDDVANRPGITRETVATFLSDAHNYPEAMDFKVAPTAIDDLAAYVLSLRRPGYKPTR